MRWRAGRRQGRQPEELAYEAMLSDEGRGMLYVPFLNYGGWQSRRDARDAQRSAFGSGLKRRWRPLRHHLRWQVSRPIC